MTLVPSELCRKNIFMLFRVEELTHHSITSKFCFIFIIYKIFMISKIFKKQRQRHFQKDLFSFFSVLASEHLQARVHSLASTTGTDQRFILNSLKWFIMLTV